MIGIPFEIERNGKMEKIYLSTQRSGRAGHAIREARNDYRRKKVEAAKLATRLAVLMTKVEKVPDDENIGQKLDGFYKEAEELTSTLVTAQEEALKAAELAVRLAVEANHGPDVEAILDCLSDKDLEQMLTALETGAAPADFFQRRATQPKPSSTMPGADGSGGNSSSAASPAPISPAAG